MPIHKLRREDLGDYGNILVSDAVPTVHLAENFARAVGRSVVDDQELFFDRHREDLRDDLADRFGLVVDGHHHRQLHGGCLLSPGSAREAATGSSKR